MKHPPEINTVILKMSAVLETETSKKTKRATMSKAIKDNHYFQSVCLFVSDTLLLFSVLKKVGDIRRNKLENFWTSTSRNH